MALMRSDYLPQWDAEAHCLMDVSNCTLKQDNFGAGVNGRNARGQTRLHAAMRIGRIAEVEMLIARGVDVKALDIRGYTALHIGCYSQGSWACEFLILHGADVNARSVNGTTPLHIAAEKVNLYTCRVLIKHGADMFAKYEMSYILAQNRRWHNYKMPATPLEYALRLRNPYMSDQYGIYKLFKRSIKEKFAAAAFVLTPKLPEDLVLLVLSQMAASSSMNVV